MKIVATTFISLCLLGSSVALADTQPVKHYDVTQDEFWHGGETAVTHTANSVENTSVNHYDVHQDEFWFGGETAVTHTANSVESTSVNHYDVTQDEFWHGG